MPIPQHIVYVHWKEAPSLLCTEKLHLKILLFPVLPHLYKNWTYIGFCQQATDSLCQMYATTKILRRHNSLEISKEFRITLPLSYFLLAKKSSIAKHSSSNKPSAYIPPSARQASPKSLPPIRTQNLARITERERRPKRDAAPLTPGRAKSSGNLRFRGCRRAQDAAAHRARRDRER